MRRAYSCINAKKGQLLKMIFASKWPNYNLQHYKRQIWVKNLKPFLNLKSQHSLSALLYVKLENEFLTVSYMSLSKQVNKRNI